MEGKLLQNFILKTSETSINIDNLERGVYFLKIYTEKEVITNKLIKK
ncbi:MAG: T9SS type A sorting domain-containing protein [Bacteroidales bacterium]|nr:T9SS type A sorting domain-containing protein [Bacteroidales bacterium]